jgi:hypothetical protein
MFKRTIQILVATALVLGAIGAPASAGAATTGGPGSAYTLTAAVAEQGALIGSVVALVDVELSCAPNGDFGPPEPSQSFAFLSITQAVSKKAVARGSAGLGGFDCDGSPHTYQLTFSLDSTSQVPFKKGTAVVSGQISACGYNPNTFEFGCGSVTVGPAEVRIR